MILPIYVNPHPILREPTVPVQQITPDLIQLVQNMRQTMHNAKGMGLAAPQIGKSIQLFILEYIDDEGFPVIPFTVVINPKFTKLSKHQVWDEEACLSLPDLSGKVRRPESVSLTYLDLDGNKIEMDASGILARSLQHENDHLIGKLFTDYVPTDKLKYYEAPLYPRVIPNQD